MQSFETQVGWGLTDAWLPLALCSLDFGSASQNVFVYFFLYIPFLLFWFSSQKSFTPSGTKASSHESREGPWPKALVKGTGMFCDVFEKIYQIPLKH